MKQTDHIYSADAWWNVNKYQAKIIGIVPAILLSELIFSRIRFKSEEFFITAKELEDTLGIGEEARRNALKKLVDLGLITITAKGVPKRYFYRINDQRINEIMAVARDEESTTLETSEQRSSEQANPDTIIKKDIKKEIKNKYITVDEPLTPQTEKPTNQLRRDNDPFTVQYNFERSAIVYEEIDFYFRQKYKSSAKKELNECNLIADLCISESEEDLRKEVRDKLIRYECHPFWKDKFSPSPKYLYKAWAQLDTVVLPDWIEKGFATEEEFKEHKREEFEQMKREFHAQT